LQFYLHIIWKVGGIDLLLERAQTVAHHDDFVEEGLDRPAFLLQSFCAWTQHKCATAPFFGGHRRRNSRLLTDDAPEQRFEIV
jgi:hypothetical protein